MKKRTTDDVGRALADLREILLKRMREHGIASTGVPDLTAMRRDHANLKDYVFYNPSLTLIVQGATRSDLGGREYVYGEGDAMLAATDVPAILRYSDISPKKPFLSVTVDFDRHRIGTDLERAGKAFPLTKKLRNRPRNAVEIRKADYPTVDFFRRFAGLLGKTDWADLFLPAFRAELRALLLTGPFGDAIKAVTSKGTPTNKMAQAMSVIRAGREGQVDMDETADLVGADRNRFNRDFREVTNMFPGVYLKYCCFFEARRLMFEEGKDVNTASRMVGFESSSQFNKEYKKRYGVPPQRDVNRMRLERDDPETANARPFPEEEDDDEEFLYGDGSGDGFPDADEGTEDGEDPGSDSEYDSDEDDEWENH
ncbi:MAG: AraC family transcriptional regulator [Deltaproteobacteria bacterium]|jgi:AraC-like DNA-binding protein|nr:AraC family transcriptional regulator [Deltaproteobacteria bacterium]